MLRWIRLKRYCEVSGETPDAVHKRLQRGIWLKDVHVRRPEGSSELWVNVEAQRDWVEGRMPAHLHGSAK